MPKHELLDEVWGDRFVSESALTSRIKAARRAVGDDGAAQRVIRTSFGRGYQFVRRRRETVLETPCPGSGPTASRRRTSSRRSGSATTDDGTRIAYALVGDGPPLVKAANWMTHLDFERAARSGSHWIEDLSHDRSLLRYDERGLRAVGLGRRPVRLRRLGRRPVAVVDAAGSTASRCSACPRAPRWPSPSPCAIPSGSAGSCCTARTPGGGWNGPTRTSSCAAAALDIELATGRLGE